MASKMNRRKKLRKHLGSFAIIGVVLLLLIFVSVASLSLRVTNGNKQERIAELESQIEAEEKRQKNLKNIKNMFRQKNTLKK